MLVYVSGRLGQVPIGFSAPVLAILCLWSEKMQITDPAADFKIVLTEIDLLNVVTVQIQVLT